MSECKHYADLYGRCVDCGKTGEQRAQEPRSIAEVIGTVSTDLALGHLTGGPPQRSEPDERESDTPSTMVASIAARM